MNTMLVKRLFSALQTGKSVEVEALCRRIIDDERKRGHSKVAEDLERALSAANKAPTNLQQPALGGSLVPLSKREAAPLVHIIPHDRLRHHMVLSENVESRFCTIEREFAARQRLAAHGLKPSRRILLYGPPGCGKSLGAERLAWSTGLALHRVRFDTLLSSYFGETLTNLRRVFDDVAKAPSALLLDECDTLARSRSERNDVGEISRITNALLELLEEYQGDGLIIAATNLDSALDSALFRRFDEVIKMPPPSVKEIARLMETTLSGIKIESGIDWQRTAGQLDGMSYSEVVQIAQTAAKRAIMEGGDLVRKGHLSQAMQEAAFRAQ